MTTSLAAYYAARAAEYERIYDKPERQGDLAHLRSTIADYFSGCRVLEIACGTGYWTAEMATTAKSIVASDIGAEVLEVAKAKSLSPRAAVSFTVADAFDLRTVAGHFDAAFAGFWWSHVRRDRIDAFLKQFHDRLERGARVMILDNRYVEGSSTPISRIDTNGNTFQMRRLSNGGSHEVLKNFPSPPEVRDRLAARAAAALRIVEMQFYWYATYRVG